MEKNAVLDEYKKELLSKAKSKGVKIDLENPKTIQDKIHWLMLYDDKMDLKTKCADKIRIHEYCVDKLGEDICVPIIKVYDNPEDILSDWEIFPNYFVVKCNHGYNMNVIVRDKHSVIKEHIVNLMKKNLENNFGENSYQIHYANINKKCFVEHYIFDEKQKKSLFDYKFWCFNGTPMFVGVNDGNGHGDITQYDMSFKQIYLYPKKPDNEYKHYDKPTNFDLMVEYAKKLSSEFKFVRVDFYEVNNKVYLGELTFTPGAGLFNFKDYETNLYWGQQIELLENTEGVSICITAYDTSDYIEDALDSIENQTWFNKTKKFEVLLGIDACQKTLEKVEKIQHKYRNLRVFMMDSNMGTYVTSNTLIKLAKYNNIIRFDSDDIMLSNMVEYIMVNKGDSDIYRFNLQNFGANSNVYQSEGPCFIKKDFILKYGGYQPWKCSSDSELKKRLFGVGIQNHTNEILFLRRIHDNSLTRKNGETQMFGKIGNYRLEKIKYIDNLSIKTDKERKIKLVENTYKEIFPKFDKITTDTRNIEEKIRETKKTQQINETKTVNTTMLELMYGSINGINLGEYRNRNFNARKRSIVKKH